MSLATGLKNLQSLLKVSSYWNLNDALTGVAEKVINLKYYHIGI